MLGRCCVPLAKLEYPFAFRYFILLCYIQRKAEYCLIQQETSQSSIILCRCVKLGNSSARCDSRQRDLQYVESGQ